ncbi:hypothetical protein D3C85_1852380 [compost metagenome]
MTKTVVAIMEPSALTLVLLGMPGRGHERWTCQSRFMIAASKAVTSPRFVFKHTTVPAVP